MSVRVKVGKTSTVMVTYPANSSFHFPPAAKVSFSRPRYISLVAIPPTMAMAVLELIPAAQHG
jgi:hypothetical protein